MNIFTFFLYFTLSTDKDLYLLLLFLLILSIIFDLLSSSEFLGGKTDCLDSDDNPLVNSRGVKDVWDLVQFVPFLKYDN